MNSMKQVDILISKNQVLATNNTVSHRNFIGKNFSLRVASDEN